MPDIQSKTALVTGASSGFGREFAKIFAEHGHNLVLVARRRERLLELKNALEKQHNVSVMVLAQDLTEAGAAEKIQAAVAAQQIHIDYLVNNAGFGGHGKFYRRDWALDEAMINVNVMALAALTRLFLPDMVARNRGSILNVASGAGFLPGPLQAVYYASKAFVVSFTQALSEELSDTNVKVMVLCPGPAETEFARVGNLEHTYLFHRKQSSARAVAEAGFRALQKSRVIVFLSKPQGFLLRRIMPLLPMKTMLKVSRKYMEAA